MPFNRKCVFLSVICALAMSVSSGNVGRNIAETTDPTITTDPLEGLRRSRDNIQRLLGDSPKVTIGNFSNWDLSAQVSYLLTASPSNVQEIQRLITAVKTEGLSIRCANRGWSWSNLFPDEYQFLIDTKDIVTLESGEAFQLDQSDSKNPKVTVAAGLRQGKLIEFLLEHDLQVINMPTAKGISLVGSMSTASHADNIRHASINQYITSIKLVDGDGEIREFNNKDNPDEMETVKSCVGMCGVIYELTIKVEPLYGVVETNAWERLAKTFRNLTYLHEMHNQGSIHYFIAPLSSLTYEQWMQYSATGIIPDKYDPWNDIAWVKTMVRNDDFNTSTCTFNMDTMEKEKEKESSIDEPNDLEADIKLPVNEADDSEPELFRHWRWYNNTRRATEGVKENCLPILQGGGGILRNPLRDIEFVIPDDENFSNTLKLVQLMLQDLKNRVTGPNPQVPYINFYFRWNAREENCLLCAGNIGGARHIIHMSAVGTSDIPPMVYQAFLSELFEKLKEEFPDLRQHWAKSDENITKLPEQLRKSYGANLVRFMQRRERLGLDKDNIFGNKYLNQIFF